MKKRIDFLAYMIVGLFAFNTINAQNCSTPSPAAGLNPTDVTYGQALPSWVDACALMDGNESGARWSTPSTNAGTPVTFTMEFQSAVQFDQLKIAYRKGDERKADFSIEVSNDAVSWSPVLTHQQSSGTTVSFETFDFGSQNAQYVRYLGYGVTFNSNGNWGNGNEIFEIQILNTGSGTGGGTNNNTAIRINAGGPAMTHDGKQFDADQYYVGGSPYEKTTAQVPVLYQTERSGSARTFDYNIPVTNGDYDVTLHFADIYWGATGGGAGGVGKRIFDVTLEGTKVLDDYDIYAEVGGETISVKNYSVTISDGELNLNFSSLATVGGVDQAKVSAIEVVPSSGSGSGGLWTASGTDGIYFNSGHVGIGVTPRSDYMLAVAGDIIGEKVRVELQGSWPDYVFTDGYALPTLAEVQQQIQENGHLPNMPSAAEVEAKGIDLGEMNKLLLEKVEELTLYIIQQDQRQKLLESRIKTLEKK